MGLTSGKRLHMFTLYDLKAVQSSFIHVSGLYLDHKPCRHSNVKFVHLNLEDSQNTYNMHIISPTIEHGVNRQ